MNIHSIPKISLIICLNIYVYLKNNIVDRLSIAYISNPFSPCKSICRVSFFVDIRITTYLITTYL